MRRGFCARESSSYNTVVTVHYYTIIRYFNKLLLYHWKSWWELDAVVGPKITIAENLKTRISVDYLTIISQSMLNIRSCHSCYVEARFTVRN